MSLLRAAALALIPGAILLLAYGCHSSTNGGDVILAQGVAQVTLPDGRVFVIDSVDQLVRVLDGTKGQVSEPVSFGSNAAGGVALDVYGNRVWITHRDHQRVAVFDATTLAQVATVGTGLFPGAIALDQLGARAYIANEGDDTLSVFSTVDPFDEIAGSPLTVGATPIAVAVAGGAVVVANRDDATISVFDTTTLLEVPGSPFAVGATPVDLVADPTDGLVFVVSRDGGTVSAYDALGNTVTTVITGLASPVAIARASTTDLLYIVEAGGSLNVFSSTAAPAAQVGSPVAVGGTLAGVSVNGFLSRVYISDTDTGRIIAHNATSPFAEFDPTSRPRIGGAPGKSVAVEPTLLRTLLAGSGTTESSFVDAGLLYIGRNDETGLAPAFNSVDILDNGDPRATFAAAFLGFQLLPVIGAFDFVLDLVARDGYAYSTDGVAGIMVIDATTPTAPFIARSLDLPQNVGDLFLPPDLEFLIGASGSVLSVFDIVDPPNAFQVTVAGVGGNGIAYDANNGFIYSGNSGVPISVDVYSTNSLPLLGPVETVDVPASIIDVQAINNKHFAAATGVDGVKIFEFIENGGSFLKSSINTGFFVSDLYVLFDALVVPDGFGGLHLYDLTDLASPQPLGFIQLPEAPRELRVFGNNLHACCGDSGLLIYRFMP